MRHEKQVELLKRLMDQLDQGVNADAGGLMQIPASTYTCPDLAAREREVFFRSHPQIIGMSGDLPEPGTFLTLNDWGTPILATRDSGGKFHAFLNSCRHRGAGVESERRGKRQTFSCPFHAWTYASDGELVGVPEEEHFGTFDRECRSLIELPAEEKFGFLCVHPDPEGDLDTDALFAGLSDDMVSWDFGKLVNGGETTYDMGLNWKLAIDTFGETYHFKRLHKNTLGLMFHGDVLAYDIFDRNHRMVLCIKEIDNLRNKPETEWNITTGAFPVYYLFPNVQVNVGATGITLVRIYPDPQDPGRSISHISFYFIQEALDADPEMIKDRSNTFARVIRDEDFTIGATIQDGLNAGIQKEVLFGRNEPPLHHYHNTYREALGLEPFELLQEV